MADAKHVSILKKGVAALEKWVAENPGSSLDLSGADLRGINLQGVLLLETVVDFQKANLQNAILDSALFGKASFIEADLRNAGLHKTYLSGADMRGADLREAFLVETDFTEAVLTEANIRETWLRGTHFQFADLIQTDLSGAKLEWVDLGEANLEKANLRDATLFRVQASAANFSHAALTGACIADWKINCETNLKGIVCDYIYLKEDYQERRPRIGEFRAGEFIALFRQVQNTIDLIFVDGINWKAFFNSYQEVRQKYNEDDISIQAIERKNSESFVIRLEVAEIAERAAIEKCLKAEYDTQLAIVEGHYEKQFLLQGRHLNDARRTIDIERKRNATLEGVLTSMANSHQGPKYDLRGAQFSGGMAETVQGDQIGGTINNYGAKLEVITQLLFALREQAQAFPDEYRNDALDTINDLEADLKKAPPDQNKMRRRLKRLVAAASAVGAITGSAATFSGNLNDFTDNISEISKTIGIPIEQIKP